MSNIRHVLRRKFETPQGIMYREYNVYAPKSKADKLKVFDDDYSLGDTYKKTSSDGTRVLYGYGSKDQTGEMFIPPKGYKITPSRFVPNGSYKKKNIIAFKNNKKRKEHF